MVHPPPPRAAASRRSPSPGAPREADGPAGRPAKAPPLEPGPWLRNPHLQTLWQTLWRHQPRPPYRRERLELPDGDFLDLDWLEPDRQPPDERPLVLVLHGLEGSSRSPYARALTHACRRAGLGSVVMHFRGCGGEPNRLPRSYHSGETGDLATTIAHLRERWPRRPLGAVGFSLGGNVLLKWLGETGTRTLGGAVAVSVPFLLERSAARLERGFSRLYQWWLLRSLRRSLLRKQAVRAIPPPVAPRELRRLRTFRAFDEHVTAPLHGFRGAGHYYRVASSRQYLGGIRTPTLIIQARDDPFMSPDALPEPDELSPCTRLELSSRGGHVGFVDRPRMAVLPARARDGGHGPAPWWLEARIVEWLLPRLVPVGGESGGGDGDGGGPGAAQQAG